MNLKEIERFLHQQIPITKAMGVQLESCDGEGLVLSAPLEENHNHLGTAFGGSLSAIATLAGYALIWLELGDKDCHVVIRDCSINYRRPVRGRIRAVCSRPSEETVRKFQKEFAGKGRARLRLKVMIEEGGESAVEFDGTYVARKQEK